MKITDGHKFKGNRQRRHLIARLVRNAQSPSKTCIRCNVGVFLDSGDATIPLCFSCLNHLARPLDAKSYRG